MIDTHQHFWIYDAAEYGWIDDSMAPLRRDFLPADAQREMAAAGVDGVASPCRRASRSRKRAGCSSSRTHHPFIAGVVGWVDLQAADVDAELERVRAHPRLVGVRHIVQAEPDGFLERPGFRRGIGCLERHGLTYDILVYARQLPEAVDFARAFPRQRVRARSSGQAGHPAATATPSGGAISTRSRSCPTYAASCRAS